MVKTGLCEDRESEDVPCACGAAEGQPCWSLCKVRLVRGDQSKVVAGAAEPTARVRIFAEHDRPGDHNRVVQATGWWARFKALFRRRKLLARGEMYDGPVDIEQVLTTLPPGIYRVQLIDRGLVRASMTVETWVD